MFAPVLRGRQQIPLGRPARPAQSRLRGPQARQGYAQPRPQVPSHPLDLRQLDCTIPGWQTFCWLSSHCTIAAKACSRLTDSMCHCQAIAGTVVAAMS